MIKKKYCKIRWISYILIILAFYFLITEIPLVNDYVANPEKLKLFVLSFGIIAPLAIIILQFIQTTISIIPSQITTIVAGFVFGSILGLVYSLIGAFLGSLFVFFLAKKYGKKLALKFFHKQDLVHFNQLFKQKKLWALFLARITPLFPNDLVSFGAGLTGMKIKNFNWVSTFGFLIQMVILTYFGAELATGVISWKLILISILVGLLFLLALFEKQIKKILIKDLHKIEKQIHQEFKRI